MFKLFYKHWAMMPISEGSSMSKEVAKKETTTAMQAYTQADLADWGAPQIDAKDIVIPRINLAQQMSELVIAGKAKMGEYYDSSSMTVLGGLGKPLDVIPFMLDQVWVIQKRVGKKFEYEKTEAVTPSNKDLPWEFVEEGVEKKRVYTRNFFCIVEGVTLPCIVSFQSSSAKAGKELATIMFAENKLNNLPPSAYHVNIDSKMVSNDDGTYAVKTIVKGKQSTREEVAKTLEWFKTFKTEAPKIDTTGALHAEF